MNSERRDTRLFPLLLGLTIFAALAATLPAFAGDDVLFSPDNLVVSRSVYDNKASNVTVGKDSASQLHEFLCYCRVRRQLSDGLEQRPN